MDSFVLYQALLMNMETCNVVTTLESLEGHPTLALVVEFHLQKFLKNSVRFLVVPSKDLQLVEDNVNQGNVVVKAP
jgi:hypothetical protein